MHVKDLAEWLAYCKWSWKMSYYVAKQQNILMTEEKGGKALIFITSLLEYPCGALF